MGLINQKAFGEGVITALLVALMLTSLPAFGQTGRLYELTWSTIDGGGGVSSDRQYIIRGTIGQADAGAMSGGDYELLGGFWSGTPLCTVDFYDYAGFAEYWLETGSDLPADLYGDDIIDGFDLGLFVDEWLYYCPYDWPLR